MIVPPAMMTANFISTLPRTRCSRDATRDLPTMWARSVPTTKFIGRPVINSPGPARKLPPTPKNPPSLCRCFHKRRAKCSSRTILSVSYRRAKVMIDCGLDWLGKFQRLHPAAIVLTHAHPDHAWGLRNGAPCTVYAPEKTWQELLHYPIKERRLIKERTPTKICGITF